MKKTKLFLLCALASLRLGVEKLTRPRGSIALANELAVEKGEGVTTLLISVNATVPVTNTYIGSGKFLIYMIGTDSTASQRTGIQSSGAATKAAYPLGISDDAPYQAGDFFDVKLFGVATGEMIGIAGSTITDLDYVYAGANGLIMSAAVATGSPTVWIIGKATKTVTAIGQQVSIQHCMPFLMAITTATPNTYALGTPV